MADEYQKLYVFGYTVTLCLFIFYTSILIIFKDNFTLIVVMLILFLYVVYDINFSVRVLKLCDNSLNLNKKMLDSNKKLLENYKHTKK
jgi:hypothetical protein